MTRHLRICIGWAAIAVAVYALIWVGYRTHWSWLAGLDSAALGPTHRYGVQHPGWVRFWSVISTVFGPTGFRALGAVVIVVAALRRNLRAAVFLVAAIMLSGYLTDTAKAIAHRPRPAEALVNGELSSFPSGHAVAAMAAVLALLAMSAGFFGHGVRVTTIVAGALIVVAVGLGRVLLNVHYLSDVLAGWSLGYLWFLVCYLLVRPPPLAPPRVPDRAIGGSAGPAPRPSRRAVRVRR